MTSPLAQVRLQVEAGAKFGQVSSSRIISSPARRIQSGALFAERPIVRAVSMMILFDIFTHFARGIVVMNRCFFSAFYFNGEP
jgi:hypothetical protein